MIAYRKDQELPALGLEWRDGTGALIDFSSGWTFTVMVATSAAPNTAVLTKTTGITGAATSPNVVIDWATSDFSGLTPSATGAEHVVHVTARRTADSKDRVFRPSDPVTIALYTAPA